MRTCSCVETLQLTDDWHEQSKDTQRHNRVTVIDYFIDFLTEARDRSLIPVCGLRAASEQLWRISRNKLVSQLRPRFNVERSLICNL